MSEPITLIVGGSELKFEPTLVAYNGYLNAISMTDKVAPSHQYLKRVVSQESKEALEELLKRPGAALQLAGKLNEEFAPDLEIEVKN